MAGQVVEKLEDLAPDTRNGGDPHPELWERHEELDPRAWRRGEGPLTGLEGRRPKVGEVELPAVAPELTPEPDTVEEVTAAVVPRDRVSSDRTVDDGSGWPF